MPLKLISNTEKTLFCFQFNNYWTNELAYNYTLDRDEFKRFYLLMKETYQMIAPKKKTYAKLKRLRRIAKT